MENLSGVREGQAVRPSKGGWLWTSSVTADWRQKTEGGWREGDVHLREDGSQGGV